MLPMFHVWPHIVIVVPVMFVLVVPLCVRNAHGVQIVINMILLLALIVSLVCGTWLFPPKYVGLCSVF